MSYQDVNWGYNNDAPETENPCPLSEVNAYLAGLGYQMLARDHLAPPWHPIQWAKENCDPISLPPPHFQAKGFYDQLVYDRNVIQDMLLRLGGGGLKSGHQINATKRA